MTTRTATRSERAFRVRTYLGDMIQDTRYAPTTFRDALGLAHLRAQASLRKTMYPGTHHNQSQFVLGRYPTTPTAWRIGL